MAHVVLRNGNTWYARLKDENGRWRYRRTYQSERGMALVLAKHWEAEDELTRLAALGDGEAADLAHVYEKRGKRGSVWYASIKDPDGKWRFHKTFQATRARAAAVCRVLRERADAERATVRK